MEVVNLLAADKPLPRRNFDHLLPGRIPWPGAPGADRPVVRDRIGSRPHGPEPVAAVGSTAQPAASPDPAVGVLHVVEAVIVGLPDLDAGPANPLTPHAGAWTVPDT